LLKRHVDLAAITHEQLKATIDRVYRKTEQIGAFAREVEREIGEQDKVIDLTSMSRAISDADAPIVKLLQTIFDDAARVNASDIHFEPQEHALVVRFRIDGVLHVQVEADPLITSALIVRLKLMAQLDIAERRLPQDGRISIKSGESRFDIRMSTMPTQFGESIVLRLLRQGGDRKGIRDLLPTWACEQFERAIHAPHGIVLVTGPTGSGKTTTLYCRARNTEPAEREDPHCRGPGRISPPRCQPGADQRQDRSHVRTGAAVAAASGSRCAAGRLRSATTRPPTLPVRAAMTGHMVLSTLHTNDAPSTPVRLLNMGVPGYMIALDIAAVVAQRLLRVSCLYCAEPYEPAVDERAWLAHHASAEELSLARFRRGRGCSRCNGVGFSGRRGVYELLEMTQALTDALQARNAQQIDKLGREQIGRRTLAHAAVTMVLEGRTTAAGSDDDRGIRTADANLPLRGAQQARRADDGRIESASPQAVAKWLLESDIAPTRIRELPKAGRASGVAGEA
jgi:MSHA biogenesis protein MshE